MAAKSTNTALGFSELLLLVFIVLKLTKVIDWSWWWVLSPLWIGIVLYALIILVGIILAIIKD
ncbi:MAG: hypothetical protein J6R57_02940 [Bacteroidales bacterium]|nr:hypothetical protein [Bacteroidales bacterium]